MREVQERSRIGVEAARDRFDRGAAAGGTVREPSRLVEEKTRPFSPQTAVGPSFLRQAPPSFAIMRAASEGARGPQAARHVAETVS